MGNGDPEKNKKKVLAKKSTPVTSVARKSDPIPIDPSNGEGRSINTSDLLVGDIIVSTTSAKISKAIRAVTSSDVSHSLLYVGGDLVVEAIAEGVVHRSANEALRDASVAAAFRHVEMDSSIALKVKDFAGQQFDKPYNKVGIVKQLLFKVDYYTFCRKKEGEELENCKNWVGRVNLGKGNDSSFFCSELVIAAFQAAGIDLTNTPPVWTSPDDIVQLSFKKGKLVYVGHVRN